MVRVGFAACILIPLFCIAGCGAPEQSTSNNDDWFRKQNAEFDRLHADHVKQSSKAVQGYQRYRNRQ